VPSWHEEHLAREDLPVIVLFDGWASFFRDRVVPWRIALAQKTRQQLEQEVLPRFVESQRWYAAKDQAVRNVRLGDHVLWERNQHTWLAALFDVEGDSGAESYFVPLTLEWERKGGERPPVEHAPSIIAKVREQATVGVMIDAFADEAFCRALVEGIGAGGEVATTQGRLRFVPTAQYAAIAGTDIAALAVGNPQPSSSNTVITLGDRLLLKGYRRVRRGVNPEFEMGRFLTEVARFPHCAPVAGALEHVAPDGTTASLALLQGYVSNQGDGWAFTIAYLGRHFAEADTTRPLPADVHGAYVELASTLGARTAGLHRALALPGGGPAFTAEPVTDADASAWKARVRAEANATLDLLAKHSDELDESVRIQAKELLKDARPLLARIDRCAFSAAGAHKTRYHGDYHLGQVLVQRNDFVITDFEGEPARTLEERRAKHSPLRDVAGMLRSFDYARWSALRRAVKAGVDLDRVAPLGAAWEQQAREAFVAAYDAAIQGAGVYASLDKARGLLDLFVLEKALYELRYELTNRPDWAAIPLHGILALAR